MKELLQNIMYAGIGAATLTKEKLEELQDELIEKGKMSRDEGKQFVDELRSKSEKAKEQLDQWITRRVDDQVKQLNLASKDEIAALRQKVDELRALLEKQGQ